jgi:hypothetical protein
MKTFDLERELREQDGSELKLGAVATDLALVPESVRSMYTPDGVAQFNNIFDTNGCASRAPLNILETKLNYFTDHGMHPDLKKWFTNNGFTKYGKFVLCDAFIEILSGTTPQGNSLKAPVDTIYRYGVIPAHLIPLEDGMSWNEYSNPKRVTQAHKDLGKEFLKRIGLAYEQVPLSNFRSYLTKDLLDVAGHGWPAPVNGVYPKTDAPLNHAFACVDTQIGALDNYEPFNKKLAQNFAFFDWGYTFSITRQTPNPTQEVISLYQKLIKVLQQILSIMKA